MVRGHHLPLPHQPARLPLQRVRTHDEDKKTKRRGGKCAGHSEGTARARRLAAAAHLDGPRPRGDWRAPRSAGPRGHSAASSELQTRCRPSCDTPGGGAAWTSPGVFLQNAALLGTRHSSAAPGSSNVSIRGRWGAAVSVPKVSQLVELVHEPNSARREIFGQNRVYTARFATCAL